MRRVLILTIAAAADRTTIKGEPAMRFVLLKATCLSMLLLAAPLGCRREEESAAPRDQAGKIVTPSTTGSATPAHARAKPIDASYVATCFPAAVVLHPARIARSPLAASLLQEAPVASAVRKTNIDIATIEEIIVLLPPLGKGGPNPKQDLPCFIVRFSKPIVAKELVAKFFAAVLPQLAELQAAQFEGRACYRVAAAPWVLVHAPTDRTLLVAAEDRLRAMLAEPKGRGPLAERLAAADGDHDAILAVAAEPVHEFVHDGVQDARRHAPPPIVAIAEGVEVLQGGTLALDLARET